MFNFSSLGGSQGPITYPGIRQPLAPAKKENLTAETTANGDTLSLETGARTAQSARQSVYSSKQQAADDPLSARAWSNDAASASRNENTLAAEDDGKNDELYGFRAGGEPQNFGTEPPQQPAEPNTYLSGSIGDTDNAGVFKRLMQLAGAAPASSTLAAVA